MRADSAIGPRLARVIPLRPIELPTVPSGRVQLPRLGLRWRRTPRVDGMVALAEFGRETGARC